MMHREVVPDTPVCTDPSQDMESEFFETREVGEKRGCGMRVCLYVIHVLPTMVCFIESRFCKKREVVEKACSGVRMHVEVLLLL